MSTEHHNDTCKEKFFHKNGDVDLLGKRKKKKYSHYSEEYFCNINYQQHLLKKDSETSLLQEKIVVSETISFSYVDFKDKLSIFCFPNKIAFQEKVLKSNYFISNSNSILSLL